MPTPWRATVRPVRASLPLSLNRWNAVLVRRTCTLDFGQPVVDLLVYLWRVGSDEGLDLHISVLKAKKSPDEHARRGWRQRKIGCGRCAAI